MNMRAAIISTLLLFGLLAQAQGPVPRKATEFTIVQPDGSKTLLSSYKGKVVLIQFLLTTCPHCQAMSQMLTRLQAEFGPRGFQAIGVASFDASVNAAQAAAYKSDFKVGFPVGYAERNAVISYLGFSPSDRIFVPQAVMIDKKGVIREQSDTQGATTLNDEAYLRDMIDKLLKETD